MSEIPDDVLDRVERALTEATATALTLGPALDKPYPDDPRWSPNTRFLEPMGRRAFDAKVVLRKAREGK
jgi:hypothetical protein